MIVDNEGIFIPAGEGFFVLDFNGEIILERMEIEVVGNGEINIENTDYLGVASWEKIIEGKDYPKKERLKCSDIKVNYKSEEDFSISAIKVYGMKNVKSYMYTEGEVLIDEHSVRNPLNPYRRPICKYVELLAEDILKDEGNNISDHEKIMCFMKYISGYKVGYTKMDGQDYLYDVIIRKIGSCGDYSNLLTALCATQGMECRLISLNNIQMDDNTKSGHVVTEIKVQGRWCMYDPTYVCYYTTTPQNESTPYVLSFEELRNGRGNSKEVTKVVGDENHIISDWSYKFFAPQVYVEARPAGVISPSNKLFYPFEIEYGDGGTVSFDGFQGVNYIGMGSTGNAHIWTINGLEPGKRYKFVVNSYGLADQAGYERLETNVYSKDAQIIDGEKKYWCSREDNWEILFVSEEESVELTLDYKEQGEGYLYVGLTSICIYEVE